uniref:Uncharacterized protein n=2 Tax=Citrifermentans bremense TaxID=60035 RepID=A0A6S6M5C9_9BACT
MYGYEKIIGSSNGSWLVWRDAGFCGRPQQHEDGHEGRRTGCALQAESIQDKINRLDSEVAKGEKKYNAKDLANLKKKLSEANKILDVLNRQ